MTDIIKNFWNDEEGATAIEYGLIAGLIAVVIIAAMSTLGGGLSDIFTEIAGKLTGVGNDIKGGTTTTTPQG